MGGGTSCSGPQVGIGLSSPPPPRLGWAGLPDVSTARGLPIRGRQLQNVPQVSGSSSFWIFRIFPGSPRSASCFPCYPHTGSPVSAPHPESPCRAPQCGLRFRVYTQDSVSCRWPSHCCPRPRGEVRGPDVACRLGTGACVALVCFIGPFLWALSAPSPTSGYSQGVLQVELREKGQGSPVCTSPPPRTERAHLHHPLGGRVGSTGIGGDTGTRGDLAATGRPLGHDAFCCFKYI